MRDWMLRRAAWLDSTPAGAARLARGHRELAPVATAVGGSRPSPCPAGGGSCRVGQPERGAYMITATPSRQIAAPVTS